MYLTIYHAGGIFFILTLIHFIADFCFQSHKTATNKHNNPLIRAEHCFIYMAIFIPFMMLWGFELWKLYTAIAILFLSHFYIDTYHLQYLWVKYIRKPPEMAIENAVFVYRSDGRIFNPRNDKESFIAFMELPLGLILVLVIDQLLHIICLLPLVWMAVN